MPAARQERHDGARPDQSKREAQCLLVPRGLGRVGTRGGYAIDERVPEETDGYAGLLVERRFEREDRQGQCDIALHGLHPARPPGPELRGHVVDDRHASGRDQRHEAEVEVRIVHDDERIGRSLGGSPPEPPQHGVGGRQDAHGLSQPGHREAGVVADEAHAGLAAQRPAEAEDVEPGLARPKRLCQRAGI